MRKHTDPQTLPRAKMGYALKKKSREENVRTQVPKDGNHFCQSDLDGKWSGESPLLETPQQFPLNIKRFKPPAEM